MGNFRVPTKSVDGITIPYYDDKDKYLNINCKYNFLSEEYEAVHMSKQESLFYSLYSISDLDKIKIDRNFFANTPSSEQFLSIGNLYEKNSLSYLFPMEISINFKLFLTSELDANSFTNRYIFTDDQFKEICTGEYSVLDTLHRDTHLEGFKQIIGYKISKTVVSGGRPNKESVYINTTNYKDNEFITFIDTKVKYNQDYSYEIFAIMLYMESELKIRDFAISEELTKQVRVIDFPPLPPQIDILPLVGNSTTVNIFLTTEGGILEAPMLSINKNSKLVDNLPGQINSWTIKEDLCLFKSDQKNKKYVMIRTSVEPNSYDDFFVVGDMKIKYLEDYQDYIQDVLEENTKYYYIFFALDYHNHISNPSSVYTVKLNNESGFIYSEVNVHNFRDKNIDLKENIKYLSNNIKFSPKSWHINTPVEKFNNLPNDFTDDNLKNIRPGLVMPDIWGKNFKFRITSISTGKKIDIDLKYEIKNN